MPAESILEKFWQQQQEVIAQSSTLYEALNESLKQYNLSWDDIEAVVIGSDYKWEGNKLVGQVRILDKQEAAQILQSGHLANIYAVSEPDDRPFYAYTKDRIFFIEVADEFAEYSIGSIPRNPTDKEFPQRLPSF